MQDWKQLSVGCRDTWLPNRLTQRGLGTPAAATDVYGLGGILFTILYGKPPNGEWPTPINESLTTLTMRFCTFLRTELITRQVFIRGKALPLRAPVILLRLHLLVA